MYETSIYVTLSIIQDCHVHVHKLSEVNTWKTPVWSTQHDTLYLSYHSVYQKTTFVCTFIYLICILIKILSSRHYLGHFTSIPFTQPLITTPKTLRELVFGSSHLINPIRFFQFTKSYKNHLLSFHPTLDYYLTNPQFLKSKIKNTSPLCIFYII